MKTQTPTPQLSREEEQKFDEQVVQTFGRYTLGNNDMNTENIIIHCRPEVLTQFIAESNQRAVERAEKAFLDELIAFRSVYVYDDYSSLYQQSEKIWLEYAEKESEFINKKLEALQTKGQDE